MSTRFRYAWHRVSSIQMDEVIEMSIDYGEWRIVAVVNRVKKDHA